MADEPTQDLHQKLEQIASLEEAHRLHGVRFSLRGPTIHTLKDTTTVVTTDEVVDQVSQVIQRVIELDAKVAEIPLQEPVPLED